MSAIDVHPRIHARHPEISDGDVVAATRGMVCYHQRDDGEWLSVGSDERSRLLELAYVYDSAKDGRAGGEAHRQRAQGQPRRHIPRRPEEVSQLSRLEDPSGSHTRGYIGLAPQTVGLGAICIVGERGGLCAIVGTLPSPGTPRPARCPPWSVQRDAILPLWWRMWWRVWWHSTSKKEARLPFSQVGRPFLWWRGRESNP